MNEPSRPLRAKEREDIFEKKIDQRLAWAESLIDKQYRLYVWNDGKIQVLAAVDGLLITAAGMVFRNGPSTIASAVPLAIAAVPLLLSLWICLRALRSFPHSGRSQEKDDGPNLRSLKGITEHDSVSVRARGVISGVGDGVFRGGACPTPECGVAGGHRVHRYGGVCTLQP